MDEIERDINTLSQKQVLALPLLLSAGRIDKACERAGISVATYYLWMTQPAFRSEFEKQRREVIESGLHTLKMSVSEAAEVLRGLLKSDRESIQIKAATEILSHVSRFLEIEDIEKRLTAIETIVRGSE